MFILLLIVTIFLGSAYCCYFIAKKNAMNTNTWLAMGLVFGPLGVVMALLVSILSSRP